MPKNKVALDEKIICDEYVSTKIGIEAIALKYHVGKAKIKSVLTNNGIEFKKRGAQSNNEVFVVNDFRVRKYVDTEKEQYIVIDPSNNNFSSKDIDNRGGVLTTYLRQEYGIETPTLYYRRIYYMHTGNYWWEQWLEYVKVPKGETKKCPYCGWETTDITNRSGMFETHLRKEHHVSKSEYVKEFPEELPYFTLADKCLQRRFFETDKSKYVTCKVCGEKMAIVNSNHLKTHNMSIEEYVNKFGANGIVCDDTHNKLSEIAQKVNANMEYHYVSNGEKEIMSFLKDLGFSCDSNRKILNGMELDVYVPEKNIAFEYDGLYWHNELFKEKYYHLSKTEKCSQDGIQLIHIFEDEWENKRDIVKSRIKNLLSVIDKKIYARKCTTREIPIHECNKFLEENHIQGSCNCCIRLGLYYENDLVSVMTFGKQRAFMNNKNKPGFELIRFCNKVNTTVVGGASKLFSYFIKMYNPENVTSYADRRWSKGNLYEKLGFTLLNKSDPGYFYVINGKRVHRYNMRKERLISKFGCPKEISEHEFCKSKKWYRIYDCGTLHYEWGGAGKQCQPRKGKTRRGTTEEFIEKARRVHGNKYDYSKVEYINNKTKVCIICPEHGEFWQIPNSHLGGKGCHACANLRISLARKKDTASFIMEADSVHKGKYNYSNVEYKDSQTKVCIICPNHGEFWQTPANHLYGIGCPKCGKEKQTLAITSNTEEFIGKARKVHGDKYDYSKVEYINAKTKVCIICPEHGEFWQKPNNHLNGSGCSKCGGSDNLTTDGFIRKARKLHGDKYDYSKVEYINNIRKVCIICPEHGEFWQMPSEHLRGKGCPMCGGTMKLDTTGFIEKAKKVHGDKYDYSNVEYVNNRTKLCIICPKHGKFWQMPDKHLQGQGCPRCSNQMSSAENKIMGLLQSLNPQQRNREFLNGKELDIYIPSISLGIEYNGLHWHSEEFGRDRHYHLDKLNDCNDRGIRLIQIFEDEWVNHQEICKSKLMQICGLNNSPKIYARKCLVMEIKNADAKEFLTNNHIQGFARATVYLGCFYDGKLVGVMTFKREKEGYWELNRFATDISYQCIGIGGKLFKHFTVNYPFKEIKSFADRRWTTDPKDNLYTKLGFKLVEFTAPDYRYYKDGGIERHHKFGFRKQILHKKYGLPLTMTESQMVKELGYTRIWDCGLIKYVYKIWMHD